MNPIARLLPVLASGAMLFVGSAAADPAVSPQTAWTRSALKPDPALKDPLVRRGKEVFDARCRACHGAYSTAKAPPSSAPASKTRAANAPAPRVPAFNAMAMQVPGTFALQLRYQGKKPALLEERTDLTPEAVAAFVRHGGGGFMPPFRPTEVSDEDLRALGAYLARKR